MIWWILLFITSIVLHEVGHILAFKSVGRVVKVRWSMPRIREAQVLVGVVEDYDGLTWRQLRRIYLTGPIVGLITIIIPSIVYNPYALLILPHMWASRNDFTNAHYRGKP